jgi:hypothetical protein
MITGFYLSFFFLISHNYTDVHLQKDTSRASNKNGNENSFLYKQGRNSPIVKHYS